MRSKECKKRLFFEFLLKLFCVWIFFPVKYNFLSAPGPKHIIKEM